ncbi:hypothetical protein N9355_09280 [Crocinitomicaceae bacterium]|nr:hypothetical protein [Crocinitomicaceae bacterium]
MRTLLLLGTFFISALGMAQSFNDTVYFNSGEVRVVNVTKETKNAIVYQYNKSNGRVLSSRSRKSMVAGYVILNESGTVLSELENDSRGGIEEEDAKKVATAGGVAMGVGVAIGVAILVPVVALGVAIISWLGDL